MEKRKEIEERGCSDKIAEEWPQQGDADRGNVGKQVECVHSATKVTFLGLDGSKAMQLAARKRDNVLVAAFQLKGNRTLAHPMETSLSPEGGYWHQQEQGGKCQPVHPQHP